MGCPSQEVPLYSQESNDRSVMPLDLLRRTRATLLDSESLIFNRKILLTFLKSKNGKSKVTGLIINARFLITIASHYLMLITLLSWLSNHDIYDFYISIRISNHELNRVFRSILNILRVKIFARRKNSSRNIFKRVMREHEVLAKIH